VGNTLNLRNLSWIEPAKSTFWSLDDLTSMPCYECTRMSASSLIRKAQRFEAYVVHTSHCLKRCNSGAERKTLICACKQLVSALQGEADG
jgi:hypothetical protein